MPDVSRPTSDESAPQTRWDDPDASLTLVVGIAGALFLFALIVALQALYGAAERAEFQRKVVEEKPIELQSLRAAQLERLGGYRSVDPAGGVVAIPIERAMDLVVEENRPSSK